MDTHTKLGWAGMLCALIGVGVALFAAFPPLELPESARISLGVLGGALILLGLLGLAYLAVLGRMGERFRWLGRSLKNLARVRFWFYLAPTVDPPEEAVRHARNAQRLQRELVNLLIRIERMIKLYESEDFDPATYRILLLDRREKLLEVAIADLLESVMDAVPQAYRAEYESNGVAGAIVRLLQTQEENRSKLHEYIPAAVGLELYLERQKRRAVTPPAVPQPSKAGS